MSNQKPRKDAKKRKEEADLEVFIRFFDTFTRTMEGIRKALGEIQGKIDSLDTSVFGGMGVVEEKVITQGINEGAVRGGIYGVSDLIYNPNQQEYMGITKESEILRFDWAGNTLPAPKAPNKPFFKFIHCAAPALYICWVPRKSGFFLAKEDFTVVIDSVSVSPISSIVYSGRKTEESFDFYIISGFTLNRYSYHSSNNLITLQDAMTLSDIEADGSNIELTCFDDPQDDRKQWLYCTFGTNCTIIDVTGRVLGTKRNLHSRRITAITAIGGSDFVVTGDDKGLLKLWGIRWAYIGEIQAHNGRITHVIEHPEGRASISFGKDQKLFVFSFDLLQEVESLPLQEVATRVVVNKQRKGFMTQGPRKIVMWKMNSIVWLRQNTTAPVLRMILSADNGFPRQAVAMCSDNAVHILNAATGQGLTTALVHPVEPPMRSVAYRRHSDGDTLYTLAEADQSMLQLEQFDCRSNPAHLIETWEETKWTVGVTCIALYEFNPKITVQEKEMTFLKRRKSKMMPTAFLLCGRRDGCLAIVDLEKGDMNCVTQGHTGSVTHIEIDHELNQAISLGTLPSLRLWKIGHSEDEGVLVPLMDIIWKHHPITIATILRNMIAFALDHKESDQHRLVIFNTSRARKKIYVWNHVFYVTSSYILTLISKPRRTTYVLEKYDHDPENGHKMDILSVSGCRELLLFCTSSLDGTVVIRGPKNEVYRVIVLNAIPSCAEFCTPQADILLGIGKGIYVLPGDKHLTLVPRNRAVMSELSAGDSEPRVPVSARTIRDNRFQAEEEQKRDFEPFPSVGKVVADQDSQQARDLELLRLRNEDIQKIIIGQHPLDEIVPDFHNMTKQQWDDFGKSVYGDDGENRKFFASESRLACMLKMQGASGDLDNFGNID